MDLDPVRLRTLQQISTLGSMTAAAATLGYTTGAISQQMAALERATGHVLLKKVGRRVQLTDAGLILARHADRILSAQEAAGFALENMNDTLPVQVNVGVFATAAAEMLAPALAAISKRYPQLTVQSTEVDVDDASAAVSRGEVDIAFGIDYDDAPIRRATDVQLLALRAEDFSIGHADTEARSDAAVYLQSLAQERWILPPERSHYGLAIRMACRRAGFEPIVSHDVTDTATTLALASAGLGIAPVTDLMMRWAGPDLRVTPLRKTLQRRIVLARRTGPGLRPSVRAVVDALGSHMRH